MVIALSIIVYGIPVFAIACFEYFLLRNSGNLRSAENAFGFLLLFCFLVILPFVIYIAEIFRNGRGFLGYYLAVPETLSSLYHLDKAALLSFIVYLASIHVLGILPFFSIPGIIFRKRNIPKEGLVVSDAESVREFENLANGIKALRGIRGKVEVKVVKEGSGCAILKRGDNITLFISKSFLDLFLNGSIQKEEIEAIFHHEFSHVVNKDYLIPVVSKAVLNKRFALMFCFPFSLYLGIVARYSFPIEKIQHQTLSFSCPLILSVILPFLCCCLLLGSCLWAVSLFLRRCEMLADNLAIQYVSKKTLIDAIVKMSVISETAGIFEMPFASQFGSEKKKRSLFVDIMYALKTMNIFSSFNKKYFHPGIAERIALLNNPGAIVEEENTGLLRFDVFCALVIFTAAIMNLASLISAWFIKNINGEDIVFMGSSYMLYFILVILSCLPLLSLKKQFVYNVKNFSLIAVYSIFISILANAVLLIRNVAYIFQDFSGKPSWHVEMFIKLQISRIVNLCIYGFLFSVILFAVFIAVGNFILRARSRVQKAEVAS